MLEMQLPGKRRRPEETYGCSGGDGGQLICCGDLWGGRGSNGQLSKLTLSDLQTSRRSSQEKTSPPNPSKAPAPANHLFSVATPAAAAVALAALAAAVAAVASPCCRRRPPTLSSRQPPRSRRPRVPAPEKVSRVWTGAVERTFSFFFVLQASVNCAFLFSVLSHHTCGSI